MERMNEETRRKLESSAGEASDLVTRFEGMTDEELVLLAQSSDDAALKYLLNKHKTLSRPPCSYFLIGADLRTSDAGGHDRSVQGHPGLQE